MQNGSNVGMAYFSFDRPVNISLFKGERERRVKLE